MKYELNALIVNSQNRSFKIYEQDLGEFGYNITHCDAKQSDIISKAFMNDCDLILLSNNDFENDDELLEVLDYFDKNKDKHIPLILNAYTDPKLCIDNAVRHYSFFHNIFPSNERRSIILEIEKNENFRKMPCDKLLDYLRHKVNYECKYIGLNKTHEGFRWISEAVLLILADESYRKNFSAGVYKVLESKYNAKYTQIEPAIRRCMNEYQKRMDPLIKVYYFDLEPDSTQKYTATAFINKIAENIRIEYRLNYSAYMEMVDNDRRKAMNGYFLINK